MLKALTGLGHIVVMRGGQSLPYISPGTRSSGAVRYNEHTANLEVYDGINWQQLTGEVPSIELSATASSAINWAINKMAEETEYKKLAADHPAVKIAMENLEKAKQQLDVTIILSKDNDKTTS